MLSDISSTDINSLDGFIDGETFENRGTVAEAITAVENYT